MSAVSIYDGISPSFFRLPVKFSAFRKEQAEAIEHVVYDSSKPYSGICLPTGSGKSLFGVAAARAMGTKAVYLTATRALQDQVSEEFRECGMVDVRGRQNYTCGQLYVGGSYRDARERQNPSCDYGHKHECSLEHSEDCPYSAAVASAEAADLVVTNYSYWMNSRRYNSRALEADGRPAGLLICDEAGSIPDLVADFVSIKISEADEELPYRYYQGRKGMQDGGAMPDETWTTWARERRALAVEEAKRIRNAYVNKESAMKDDRFAYLTELIEKCDRIPKLDSGWVWEMDRDGVKFTPVWPGRYSSALWSSVPRVILMSATLCPYTLGLLGLGRDDYDFREWPSSFPPHLGPVYHYNCGVRLNSKSTDEDYVRMVEAMDEYIAARPGRRVLIHSVSYDRQKIVKAKSRHVARMYFNEGGWDAADKARKFRTGPEDGILVGPSYSTGHSFPDDECELNLIMKVPYPNTMSRVTKARCENHDYHMHATVQELVQMVGRVRRHERDRGETVIFDNSVRWLMGSPRNPWHGHAPAGFKVHSISAIPPAPPRASRTKIKR